MLHQQTHIAQPLQEASEGQTCLNPGQRCAQAVVDTTAKRQMTGFTAGEVEPLLTRVMTDGRRERDPLPLAELRARCRAQVASLPAPVRRLRDAAPYPVRFGAALQSTIDRLSRA